MNFLFSGVGKLGLIRERCGSWGEVSFILNHEFCSNVPNKSKLLVRVFHPILKLQGMEGRGGGGGGLNRVEGLLKI